MAWGGEEWRFRERGDGVGACTAEGRVQGVGGDKLSVGHCEACGHAVRVERACAPASSLSPRRALPEDPWRTCVLRLPAGTSRWVSKFV